MKIILPGGSGQVGTILARHYHQRGDEVVVLSRKPQPADWRVVQWDAQTPGTWTNEFEGADVVINLAGRSVNCRYNSKNREAIMQSRVDSTRIIGQTIKAAVNPPKVWLQSSTATIYAHRFDAPNDEANGIIGNDNDDTPDTWRFSIDVAKAWEAATDAFTLPRTRTVKLRSAMVMSPDAKGVFDTLLGLVRVGLGGQSENGRQYVSWIHEVDFIRAIDWIIEHEHLNDVVNLASLNPLPNFEFMRCIRDAWGIRLGLPATSWMLEIGAFFMKTETELVLKSRRVIPGKLLQDGFEFQYPSWKKATEDLCKQWRDVNTK
ncbi:TIGR01777 family oxidoreductase [Rubellicoccus peritrichatus]|uniref:TIGR01777 family oxidoreductase n=1 Tax=Rubellicoccus peritrichatus TaxID=3080537 RepID=A0AAQ3LDA1_9BACT|nr:TIGR01777 family oxidoreductase [Puniceicoccus sp. CR14]WOO43361.1 TIGR01777 family oxidoreductase [Puniceicoccus sp. CR14]